MTSPADASPQAEVVPVATTLRLYRMMLDARLYEEKAHEMFFEGLAKGTSHLATGQEAAALEDMAMPSAEPIAETFTRVGNG